MKLTFTIDLPPDLERALQASAGETSRTAREALVVSLFREGRLSHADLGQSLGLDRFQIDALLKRHEVPVGGITNADVEADRVALDKVLGSWTAQSKSRPDLYEDRLGKFAPGCRAAIGFWASSEPSQLTASVSLLWGTRSAPGRFLNDVAQIDL